MDRLSKKVALRFAADAESVRLNTIKGELRHISQRLEEIAEDIYLSPKVVTALPKEFRSKSTWLNFPKAQGMCRKASTDVAATASAIEMGISLAESVDQ